MLAFVYGHLVIYTYIVYTHVVVLVVEFFQEGAVQFDLHVASL